MIFLWVFLPIVFICYYLIQDKYRNHLLLFASIIFYAWGEPKYIILMLLVITLNYVMGILIEKYKDWGKIILVIAIVSDVGLLGYYKYFNLIADAINKIMIKDIIEFKDIALPIGISFYIFQAMSYIIDLYNRKICVQKKWTNLALYIAFFPQLIAGPIIKYKDVNEQIDERVCSIAKIAYGIKIFVYGLGKKVILANSVARIVDDIYMLDLNNIGTSLSWCIAICYTLQIYFDFSGYSDMAIGLGKMFGFDFQENFDAPYISISIREFWRRWHISLSTWFKEYLYIPLGGNRKGKIRTFLNLFIVFLVTGLWHGANYTFIIWGLWHGLFSILERLFFRKRNLNRIVLNIGAHIYTILVVIIGWVIFRSDSILEAIEIIANMFVYKRNIGYNLMAFVGIKEFVLIIGGIIICIIEPLLKKNNNFTLKYIEIPAVIIIMCVSIIYLIGNTYNPFIYFRF